jgi:NADH dehydrogenase
MILVVGATGQLGGSIVRRLLARGDYVRALVRPSSDSSALASAGAEIARGDLKDRASLDAAVVGIDTVVSTANSARRSGEDTVESVDLLGTRNLVDAAAAAGVRHFIYVSVLGATAETPIPFLAAKGQSEEYLRQSGMHWTILKPNMFMESWPMRIVGGPARAGQPVTLVGEGRRRHTFVSEEDVASFAVASVGNREAYDQAVPIGGPEALSWRDVVAVYERALGRPIEVRFAAPGEPVPGVPPAVQPLLAATDTYESVFDTAASARMFGVTLTPLEALAHS